VYKAFRNTVKNSKGADYLTAELVKHAERLASRFSVSEGIKNIMLVRSIADIMTLCGFVNEYKDEFNRMLSNYDSNTRMSKVFEDINTFYYKKQVEKGMTMPDIYQHRIGRTICL